ncbi:unnamed protein product [Brassica oleracea var. botrytis]|uniref:Uncharacterized protein n=1 Tax=Brassica oleracea TaxID=3712 RepID=A0A3P6GMC8_BRAOL|nr:unnamed protein product [Brassica oleracea]
MKSLILDMNFTVEIARYAGYPFKVVQNHASVVINRAINIFSSRGINPQRRSGSRKQPSQLSTVVNEPSLPPPKTDPSPESLGAAASRPLRQGWVQRKLRRLGYKKMELDHQFSKDNLVGKRKIQWTTWGTHWYGTYTKRVSVQLLTCIEDA